MFVLFYSFFKDKLEFVEALKDEQKDTNELMLGNLEKQSENTEDLRQLLNGRINNDKAIEAQISNLGGLVACLDEKLDDLKNLSLTVTPVDPFEA
jgi:predicted nuclease with TOPRIM domain